MLDMVDIVNIHEEYTKTGGLLSSKKLDELIAPFRDKYGLSDADALYIVKSNPINIADSFDTFIHDGVEYRVANKNFLWSIKRLGNVQEIIIPDVFPENGLSVTAVGKTFCRDKFPKITLPNTINRFCRNAFSGACAEEIVWPSNCYSIPDSCFLNSEIKRISNIDHVTDVGNSAFADSKIEEITWPSNCRTIPKKCFCNSSLASIDNIENVEAISFGAFKRTKIKYFVWPSKCYEIPDECFQGSLIENISNIDNITYIGDAAFCVASNVNQIDLSNIQINYIGSCAFYGIDQDKVIFPYYTSDDVREDAFSLILALLRMVIEA